MAGGTRGLDQALALKEFGAGPASPVLRMRAWLEMTPVASLRAAATRAYTGLPAWFHGMAANLVVRRQGCRAGIDWPPDMRGAVKAAYLAG